MNGVGGAAAYGALTNTNRTEGSVSILRRASDSAKPERSETTPEITVAGTVAGSDEDAAGAASTASRPIGNLGQHLDLKL